MNINFLNFKTMKTIRLFAMAVLAVGMLASCDSDDDNPGEVLEEEFWTRFSVTFTNDNDAFDVVTVSVIDVDGEPGPLPAEEIITGTFTSGATYSAEIVLFNDVEGEDVLNDDIIPEADEHFFTYAVAGGLDMTMQRDDNDILRSDGEKLGVETTWFPGNPGIGNLQIILRHEPTSVSDDGGFGSASGGSEDVNVTFEVLIVQ